MKLNTKLVIIMMSLLVIAILTLFAMNQYSQNDLVHEIQESSTEVSKAIQLSVEDLTSEADDQSSRLTEYLKGARDKGIHEINIIDNEGEIINSSDPAKVGKKREIRKLEKGLRASSLRGVAGSSSMRPYDLVVPVIVGDEQLGYVQINLLLDNISTIQHANFLRRLVATSLVFMLGIFLTFYLARRYTRPIHRLAENVKRVSAGDLSVTFPVETRDEIGDLAESFNEMVGKLREREALEKRLYEAEHLSKVGQLASGIAHEIRNPLNYISLAIDHLKSDILSDCSEQRRKEAETLTDKIKEEVRRANYMVLNFMNYGRPLKLRITTFAYPHLVEKVVPLLREKLDEQKIAIVTDMPDDLPPMQADQELLRNCLFNFVTNAGQAMHDGGRITLGARYDGERNVFLLTCTDQGKGIAPEELDKIFQPYFTTKEAGIGLGLAITERIVKEHGGEITVASSLGEGTTFTMVLPQKV
ncbi:sensor histidine kinase [Geomobilimonas luticola]|uniref:histidine kinase n=1 Tax=Geomobilimonas luticola TaxID=1114878 RepID=A0ABS5S892_9BACT|nr:ATP-binding protein [Geomobilimonas luticola]MBT0651591.1 HAMP domain-containing protein [Geomobilimonas luticola]